MAGSRVHGSPSSSPYRKPSGKIKLVVSPHSDLPGDPMAAGSDVFPGGFPRSRRLLSHAGFQDVYRNGRRQFSPHLTVFHLQRTSSGKVSGKNLPGGLHSGLHLGPRVGLAVASALGGAVVRNRIRRRLRAAVRPNLHQLTAPVDVVIQAKKSVLVTEFPELVREIENAFKVIETQARKAAASSQVQAAGKTGEKAGGKLEGASCKGKKLQDPSLK